MNCSKSYFCWEAQPKKKKHIKVDNTPESDEEIIDDDVDLEELTDKTTTSEEVDSDYEDVVDRQNIL